MNEGAVDAPLVWEQLRASLEADEQGRLILAELAQQREGAAAALANWLVTRAPDGSGMIAQVYGGTINQLVMIARADAVHYYGRIAEPPAPAQLPPQPMDFVDRESESIQLLDVLDQPPAGSVLTISGQPGVGKTALALRVAHACRIHYPGGQLYVDLGNNPDPYEPVSRTLGAFLRSLGAPPSSIPESLDERMRLYRTYTIDRRLLVLVENVWTEAQVRPLVPAGDHSALLLTSRRQLLALEGTYRLDLRVLAPDDAVQLLEEICGADRIHAEIQNARLIAGLCGSLPLALRIVGMRLAASPRPSLAWVVRRLLDEQRRLAELNIGDRGVRAAYMVSYERLDEEARFLFRLLGFVDTPSFTAWMVSALTGLGESDAERVLAELADHGLLEAFIEDSAGQLRYQFHDLLRVFAREQAEVDPDQERLDAALRKLLETACGLSGNHSLRLLPDAYLRPQRDPVLKGWIRSAAASPAAEYESELWMGEEQPSLFRLVGRARSAGHHDVVWRFVLAVEDYCELMGQLSAWAEMADLAVASAETTGDPLARGYALRSLGVAEVYRGYAETAIGRLEGARLVGEDTGDPMLVGTSLRAAGEAYCMVGDVSSAHRCFDRAMEIFADLNEPVWEAWTMWSKGTLGRLEPEAALAVLGETIGRFETLGDARGIAISLRTLAKIYMRRGDNRAAMRYLEQCLPMLRSIRDRTGEALTMDELGRLYLAEGREEEALPLLEASAPFLNRLGSHEGLA